MRIIVDLGEEVKIVPRDHQDAMQIQDMFEALEERGIDIRDTKFQLVRDGGEISTQILLRPTRVPQIITDDLRAAAKKIFDDGVDGFDSTANLVGYKIAGQLLVIFLRNNKELTKENCWPNPAGVDRLVEIYQRSYS